jgi:microcystin-dependent protein
MRIILSIFYLLMFCFSSVALANDHEIYRAIALEIAAQIKMQVPVGMIMPYVGKGASPDGYVECDGRSVPKHKPGNPKDPDYSHLYAVMGDEFTPPGERNGDHFFLPDLRGRVPMGSAKAESIVSAGGAKHPITERKLGAIVGEEQHTLTASESGLPAHIHTASSGGQSANHTHSVPSGGYTDRTDIDGKPGDTFQHGTKGFSAAQSTGTVSADHSHAITVDLNDAKSAASPISLLQPSLVVRYMVRWKGSLHGVVDEHEVRHSSEDNSRAPSSALDKGKTAK